MFKKKLNCFRTTTARDRDHEVYVPSSLSDHSSASSADSHEANSIASLPVSTCSSLGDDSKSKRFTFSGKTTFVASSRRSADEYSAASRMSQSQVSTFNNPTFRPQRSLRPPRRRFCVAIIGDHEVGKTSLALRLSRDTFISRYNRSSRQLFRTTMDVGGDTFELQLLDMGADVGATTHVLDLEPRVSAAVLVYSAVSPQSFVALQFLRDAVIGADCHLPCVVMANKKDLRDKDEQVRSSSGQFLARRFGAPFVEVSAKTGEGVHDAFHDLLGRIAEQDALRRCANERRSSQSDLYILTTYSAV